jgi:glucan phosphoethanolaminetransferase (alkaline phosphatase superfamily)
VPYQALANAVLLLHFAVVIFVVLGLPAILIGNWRGWAWVNNLWWRMAHLVAIAVVVLQAWLGQFCGLTVLESKLREQAGLVGYERSFIEYWVQRLLYYEGPLWVFTLVYTAFGSLVAWAWFRYPPTPRRATRNDP